MRDQSESVSATAIHEMILARARKKPCEIALLTSGGEMPYGALESTSKVIASALAAKGIGRHSLVGIYMRSDELMIPTLLGVLRLGAAFVPLDHLANSDRVRAVLEDSQLQWIVTSSSLMTELPEGPWRPYAVDVELADKHIITLESEDAACDWTDPFCVIYTSGSTGRPKGVIRTHGNVAARLPWFEYDNHDMFGHNMSLCYGFSQERLFIPLIVGRPIAVIDDQSQRDVQLFVDALERFGVTNITTVPALLQELLELGASQLGRLRKLHTIIVGSARLPRQTVERFWSVLPEKRLINAYGTTEAGSVARGEVKKVVNRIDVGIPVSNARVFFVDEDLRPVKNGIVGELVVGGPAIALGYLGNPDLTAQRFITLEIEGAAERFYRTGDRGCFVADGAIELRGRNDDQVKIRGFRVELADVESALLENPKIRECKVIAEARNGDDVLVAYVCARATEELHVVDLRKALLKQVPPYMVPSIVMVLDELPRTRNLKVDVQALPRANAAQAPARNLYVAPATALEQVIASVWEDVLGVDSIGVNDDFLEMGGNSLLAIRIANKLFDRLDRYFGASAILRYPTVAQLSEACGDRSAL